jgi:hypothetical protein
MLALTTIHAIKNNPSVLFVKVVFMFVLLVSTAHADASEGKVVLIAARGSGIEVMHLRDVRRMYLGLKSVDSMSVKNPVLNVQSSALYDEFLKNIMHMTEGGYKRKLVKRMFRQGREEIPEMASLKELNDHLLENIGDISFVEITSIESMENIEVIQILW